MGEPKRTRKDDVYDYIILFYKTWLKFPTYNEIASGLHLKGRASIASHMRVLEHEGNIEFFGMQYRLNRRAMHNIFAEILTDTPIE